MNHGDELVELLQDSTALSDRLRETVDDIRAVGCGPAPIPNDALRLFLAEQSAAVERAVVPFPRASEPTSARVPIAAEAAVLAELFGKGRRSRAGVASRLAGLGLVAKLGLGTAVAAASFTAAAAAGVLPAPVQRLVDGVFEVPFDAVSPDRGPAAPGHGVGDAKPERAPVGGIVPSEDIADGGPSVGTQLSSDPAEPVGSGAAGSGPGSGASSDSVTSIEPVPTSQPPDSQKGSSSSGPTSSDTGPSPYRDAPATDRSASPGTASGNGTGTATAAPTSSTPSAAPTSSTPSAAPTSSTTSAAPTSSTTTNFANATVARSP